MKVLHGDVWKRRGVSLLWGGQTLSVLTEPQSVVSIRQFFALQSNWPDELPCNAGKTLVVAGLEGCIDILKPSEAESWLESDLRPAIFDFQAEYDLEAALVFWLPTGKSRVRMNPATEDYYWMCSAPHSNQRLDLGRILWAGAAADVGRIMDPDHANTDPDGPAWIGLHLTRLS
jgi:hypothetical protein